MIKHYINLTNGIEALPSIPNAESYSFIRLQSTTLEHKNWNKLFGYDLDHDFYMHLALGYTCIIHDRGTRRTRSKTIYLGIPIIKYVIDRRWYNLEPEEVLGGGKSQDANNNLIDLAQFAYNTIFNTKSNEYSNTRRKIDYYKRFTCGYPIKLIGHSESTIHDGDKQFYTNLLYNSLNLM